MCHNDAKWSADMRKWLIKQRKKFEMTQANVANHAKINRAHYAKIENGSRRPSPEVAQKIASVLNFPWTRFFEDGSK